VSWRNLIWMLTILCLAGLALYLSRRRPVRVTATGPAVDDLAGAVRTYKLIQERAYRPPSPREACRGAIDGMVEAVDRYSTYVRPGAADDLHRRLSGTLEETGLRIAARDGRLVTIGSLPGSPADEAGIGADEDVAAVDGIDARYLTLERARQMLRRPGRGPVRVSLRRPDGRETLHDLEPARFPVRTVTGIARDREGRWVYDVDDRSGICYVRISEFVPRRTVSELHAAYRQMDDPRGLLLDLRGNPGGWLQAAAVTVDRFMDSGVIVRTVSRGGQEYVHRAHPAGTYAPVALAVLIDERTASAAEIVAGALKAHRRAVLVGQPTRGKWYAQTRVDIGHGLGSMYLTTAEYFLAAPLPDTRPAEAATASAPAATGPDAPASTGAAERPGVAPHVPVRLPVRAARELDLLRMGLLVRPSPPAGAVGTRRTKPARPERRTRRAVLDLDEPLAEAVRVLQRELAPETRPTATAPSPARRATRGDP